MAELSVLLPVRNGAPFLVDAVRSILEQTFGDLELLVCDDGSTDDTPEILARLAKSDRRVRWWREETGVGLPAALNRLLERAGGQWIARQDADDTSHPERLARQRAYLEANRDCALVACDIERFGEGVGPPKRMWRHRENGVMPWALLFHYPIGCGGNLMMRAATLRAAGGFDEAFPCSDDYALCVRLVEAGRIHILPDVLYRYRKGQATQLTVAEGAGYDVFSIENSRRLMGRLLGQAPDRDLAIDLRFFWRERARKRPEWNGARVRELNGIIEGLKGGLERSGWPGVDAALMARAARITAGKWIAALANRGVAGSPRVSFRVLGIAATWDRLAAARKLARRA